MESLLRRNGGLIPCPHQHQNVAEEIQPSDHCKDRIAAPTLCYQWTWSLFWDMGIEIGDEGRTGEPQHQPCCHLPSSRLVMVFSQFRGKYHHECIHSSDQTYHVWTHSDTSQREILPLHACLWHWQLLYLKMTPFLLDDLTVESSSFLPSSSNLPAISTVQESLTILRWPSGARMSVLSRICPVSKLSDNDSISRSFFLNFHNCQKSPNWNQSRLICIFQLPSHQMPVQLYLLLPFYHLTVLVK